MIHDIVQECKREMVALDVNYGILQRMTVNVIVYADDLDLVAPSEETLKRGIAI